MYSSSFRRSSLFVPTSRTTASVLAGLPKISLKNRDRSARLTRHPLPGCRSPPSPLRYRSHLIPAFMSNHLPNSKTKLLTWSPMPRIASASETTIFPPQHRIGSGKLGSSPDQGLSLHKHPGNPLPSCLLQVWRGTTPHSA